jgi:regulator of sigma E protease
VLTIVAAIVMLGILVFVHELGHFLAFKLIGVKVLKFSLGFPPAMVQKQVGETVYQIGWVPIGGYVKALGENDTDEIKPEDRGRSMMDKPPWQRIFTFVAGPAMNLLFPILLYWVVFGLPGEELSSRVGMIMEGMPAAAAGLQPGDRVVEVAGRKVSYWTDLQESISSRPAMDTPVKISRAGREFGITIRPEAIVETNKLGEKSTEGRIGISPFSPEARIYVTDEKGPAAAAGVKSWDLVTAVNGKKVQDWFQFRDAFDAAGAGRVELTLERPQDEAGVQARIARHGKPESVQPRKSAEIKAAFVSQGTLAGDGLESAGTFIRRVEPDGPADKAGIKSGDRMVYIDGKKVNYWGTVEDSFRRDPEKEFELVLARAGSTFQTKLRLLKKTEKDEFKQEQVTWTMGAWNDVNYTGGEYLNHGFQPLRAARESILSTVEVIRVTYVAVYRLITGKLSLKTVGGPIMIFDMAGTVAKKGLATYLWFMALISINLGIFNLLPVPVLDGGQVMLTGVEWISRKPLSMRMRLVTNYIGLAFLGFMFVLVFKNDIERYWDSITGFFK